MWMVNGCQPPRVTALTVGGRTTADVSGDGVAGAWWPATPTAMEQRRLDRGSGGFVHGPDAVDPVQSWGTGTGTKSVTGQGRDETRRDERGKKGRATEAAMDGTWRQSNSGGQDLGSRWDLGGGEGGRWSMFWTGCPFFGEGGRNGGARFWARRDRRLLTLDLKVGRRVSAACGSVQWRTPRARIDSILPP